jgi:hypothetical protein
VFIGGGSFLFAQPKIDPDAVKLLKSKKQSLKINTGNKTQR